MQTKLALTTLRGTRGLCEDEGARQEVDVTRSDRDRMRCNNENDSSSTMTILHVCPPKRSRLEDNISTAIAVELTVRWENRTRNVPGVIKSD